MHVYIDTWAHYGFCGTAHEINRANDITTLNADGSEIRDRNIKERLTGFFKGVFDNAASARHKKWLDAIAGGAFSFGKQKVSYTPKGEGSWKHQALATDKAKDDDHEVFRTGSASWRATGNCFTTPRSPTASTWCTISCRVTGYASGRDKPDKTVRYETARPVRFGLPILVVAPTGADFDKKREETTMSTLTLTFKEAMSGHFALGAVNPAEGADRGRRNDTTLTMHAQVIIHDIDRFVTDPEHTGELTGSIDFAPLGMGIPASVGVFNLFKPSGDPDMTYMVYELGFQHGGRDYYLAGHKEVKDDKGFDLWSDTTTLYTALHEGRDKSGKVIGAGVLSLGVKQLADLVSTIDVPNASSAGEKLAAIEKFGRFFVGELWDSYVIPKFGKQAFDKSADDTPHYDVIVIGSGFGGAVTACRLAEKGRKVLCPRTRPALGRQGLPARTRRRLVLVARRAGATQRLDRYPGLSGHGGGAGLRCRRRLADLRQRLRRGQAVRVRAGLARGDQLSGAEALL